ncbi:MAG: P-II family nitrogen regulator [Chloroflexi bacterium]|nr:P-II family nitrogen regulator [Chloroflexota bacterium]
MAELVIFVLDDPEKSPALLEAWEDAGVTGVTVLESTGMARLRGRLTQDDVPLFPSLRQLFAKGELHHLTFLLVVKDEGERERVVAVIRSTVGDLDQPNTGILFVIPLTYTWGLREQKD